MSQRVPTKENVQPFGDRVLVKPIEDEAEESKIFNVNEEKDRPNKGIVFKVGEGVPIQAGEGVIFGKFAGIPVPIEGENYLIMKQSDVLIRF